MLDQETKEYLGKELQLLKYEIKEHINTVVSKDRKDINDKINEIGAKADEANNEIRFAKRMGYVFAAIITTIMGWLGYK